MADPIQQESSDQSAEYERESDRFWKVSEQDGIYTLVGECQRYGLAHPPDISAVAAFDYLMRHIYNNHALIVAIKDETIRLLDEPFGWWVTLGSGASFFTKTLEAHIRTDEAVPLYTNIRHGKEPS